MKNSASAFQSAIRIPQSAIAITLAFRLTIILSGVITLCVTSSGVMAQKKEGPANKGATVMRRPLPKPAGGSRGFERYAGRDASARLIAAAATRGEPADAAEYREKADAYYKAGQYTEAIKAFRQSLQSNPDQPVVHFNLGVIYAEMQQYDEAIKSYQEALGLKPDYPMAFFNAGNAYLDKGEYEKAVEAYKQAAQLESIAARSYYNMGVAYVELGQQDEAIKAFKEAARLLPEYAAAYYNLGIVYGTAGRFKEASESFKQALRLKENSADAQFTLEEAHFNLGLALLKLDMKDQATEQYRVLKSMNSELSDELLSLINK